MQHFAVNGGRDNAAIKPGERKLIQRQFRQPLCLFRIAVVDGDLGAQRVKFSMQRAVHNPFDLLLGARQQRIHFAVAVLALHQPGL
ncbi:hypothetical protein NGUA15_03227 [Salmonella enterica]|nr:hypothetical protein NGUA15_03227 [Salmonella enterica]